MIPGRALLGLVAVLVGCGGPEERPRFREDGALEFDGPPPNHLLFLSIDTLRRDHLGYHGADPDLSPFLDDLAAEGVVVDDARQCSSWTFPGTTCLLAGRTNLDLGVAPGLAQEEPPAPVDARLLPDFLGDAGFWTGLVSSNLWLSPELGTGAGYADFARPGATADSVRDEGLRLLRRGPKAKQRWFLHLHHMEPHWPYLPDPERVDTSGLAPWPDDLFDSKVQGDARDAWEGMPAADQALLEAHLRALYEGEVRTLDARLAETWGELDRGGWLDDTLVVLWSDHGEQIFEHGWKGHAHSLYADESDLTVVFWARNLVSGRYSDPVAGIDIAPTVLDVLGVERPAEMTGAVLGTADANRPIFSEVVGYGGVMQSVSVGADKLVYRWDGEVERYDRASDRAEAVDRHGAGDGRSAELFEALAPAVERLDALLDASPVPPAL